MSCDVGKATESWRMSCDVGEVTARLENEQQPFSHFTYVRAHSPTLPSLYLCHRSFSNPSVASLTSPGEPTIVHSDPLVRDIAELILQTFRHFTYVTAHSPTLPSLYLLHSTFSNHSVTLPTSQLILQPFFRFSYVTGSSLTSLGQPPMEIWIVMIKLVVTPQWNKPPLSLSQK